MTPSALPCHAMIAPSTTRTWPPRGPGWGRQPARLPTAWTEGQAMMHEQAIAYALEQLEPPASA